MTGNMDKTPVIFDMMPEKSLLEKGQKSVAIQTPGSEKRHVTVVLTVAADGSILPPMTWFRDKTNQTIKDIEAPEGFVIVAQEKACMDKSLMDKSLISLVWSSMEIICRKKTKRIRF